jgi:regulator of sigma E protease
MDTLYPILKTLSLILAVVLVFNVIIFVHELGHFLAGRWRGLKIDRFQIWFGRPIWKKEINGVQYGLGWIPAGGFVSLPQMAPMEAIEGGPKSDDEKPLPPITPLDKIIVAFAGPLFSLGLALLAAVVVWIVGKPADVITTSEIGYILPGSPAAEAGLKAGDTVRMINGKPVQGFAGTLDSISESIILSRGKEISYTVQRPGVEAPITLKSGFKTEKTKWFERGGLREVGLEPASPAIVADIFPNSPAAKAGIRKNDEVVSFDGQPLHSAIALSEYLRAEKWKQVTLGVKNPAGELREVTLTPEKPQQPTGTDPMIGVAWNIRSNVDVRIVHPAPFRQISDTVRMMWTTITSVISPDSSIGVGHLSGPVGIANMQYQLLQTENGWRRILGFMVLFNVNLAILNMMPFPVLDGGHITLAIMEKIAGRPVRTRPLEIVQTICALALMSLMLFVSSKDVGDIFGRKSSGGKGATKVVFSAD